MSRFPGMQLVRRVVGLPTNSGKRPVRTRQTIRTRLRAESLEARDTPSTLAHDFVSLDQFGVLGLTGSKMDITNPQTEIGGNVGLGPNAKQNFSDGTIDGNLIVDPTADNSKSNNVQENAIVQQDLSGAMSDAQDASNLVAQMTPTQTLGNINGSTTLQSSGQINVVNVGNVTLNGSDSLTLQGGPNDYFFINVSGKFAMTGTSSIQLDGVSETHVLFNIVGTGEKLDFNGKSVAEGTFLAINRDISVAGATVNGSLIGGEGGQISIVSGSKVQVCTPHFVPPCDCSQPPPPCTTPPACNPNPPASCNQTPPPCKNTCSTAPAQTHSNHSTHRSKSDKFSHLNSLSSQLPSVFA